MRPLIVLTLAAVVGSLAGCVYVGYYPDERYGSSTIYTTDIVPRKVYFPFVFKFPDDTMFFYPQSDDPPHADLNLTAIGCDSRSDGSLVVNAKVRNQGSSIVPAVPFISGDMGAFRVAATVTTADGATEQIQAVQMVALAVAYTSNLALGPTRAQAADVVGIDVVVDPDRIVPDPLRDNNVMSWRGAMHAPKVDCTVVR